jgi:hypothetical protein
LVASIRNFHSGKGSEPLLAGSIPNLKLDCALVDFHLFDMEAGADGGGLIGHKGAIFGNTDNARLSDC